MLKILEFISRHFIFCIKTWTIAVWGLAILLLLIIIIGQNNSRKP